MESFSWEWLDESEEAVDGFTEWELEEMGLQVNPPLTEVIYILPNGITIGGKFVDGNRTVAHSDIEVLTHTGWVQGTKFWDEVLWMLGMVMVVPEEFSAYIHEQNATTEEQDWVLNQLETLGYELRDFE